MLFIDLIFYLSIYLFMYLKHSPLRRYFETHVVSPEVSLTESQTRARLVSQPPQTLHGSEPTTPLTASPGPLCAIIGKYLTFLK